MRTITFNGISSRELGLTVDSELTKIGDPAPRISEDIISFRNGAIDSSFVGGQMYYDNRSLEYVFNVIGSSRPDLENKRKAVKNWLMGKTGYLYDSDYPGWRFAEVKVSSPTEIDYISRNFRAAKLSVKMTAAPLMQSTTGVRDGITQLAGREIEGYIHKNAVYCGRYVHPEPSTMAVTVDGSNVTLSYEVSGAGLTCFAVSGNLDITLTGGSIGGAEVTITSSSTGFMTVPAGGGTLTLTGTAPEISGAPYVTIAFADGISFMSDSARHYVIDDYAVGTHTLKVGGQYMEFSGFTLPDSDYVKIEIVGEREGVYDLRYDSVEVTL